MKKSVPILILVLFSLNLVITNSIYINCWVDGDSITTTTTSEPIIDGIKDDIWEDGNSTSYQLDSLVDLSLTVSANGTNIYLLVEILNFELINEEDRDTEWVSLYLSRNISEGEESYVDKKQIVMQNANDKGNEVSEYNDLHEKPNEEDVYIGDFGKSEANTTGVARYGSGVNRIYEFKIGLKAKNITQNVNFTNGINVYLKIGHQYDPEGDESLTDPIILRIRIDTKEKEDENENTKIIIAHVVAIIIMGVFGVALIRSKPSNYSTKKDKSRGAKK
jgi:hypothetical protein